MKIGAEEMELGHATSVKNYFRWSVQVVLLVGSTAGILLSVWLQNAEIEPIVSWYFTTATVVAIAILSMFAAQVRALYGGIAGIGLERLLPQALLLAAILLMMLVGVMGTGRGVALIMLGFLLVSVLVSFILVRKRLFSIIDNNFSRPSPARRWRDDLSRGAPFFAVSFSGLVGSRVPLIAAGAILPQDDIGKFALLMSLSGLISIPTLSLNMVTGPELSAARAARDHHAISSIIKKAELICLALVIVAFLALVFLKPQIEMLLGYPGLFGDFSYYIIVLSACLLAVLNVPAVALQMTGYANQLAKIFLPLMIFKVVLGLVLGLWFGLAGFAMAELFVSCALGFLVQFQFRARLMKRMGEEEI
ncbi:hypothetical protein OAN15_02020 [bacterium]|nr:hypothetical protein [bacterium]